MISNNSQAPKLTVIPMKRRLSIVCEKIRTDDLLLWFNSRKKWRVTVTNNSEFVLYLSWCEAFTNPFDNQLWVSKIDESPQAGDRFIVNAKNVKCTNFITSGDEQRALAPDRFVQIAIHGNQTGSWIMERIKRSHWDGFSVYDESLVHQIRDLQRVPEPVERVFPKISGWLWA